MCICTTSPEHRVERAARPTQIRPASVCSYCQASSRRWCGRRSTGRYGRWRVACDYRLVESALTRPRPPRTWRVWLHNAAEPSAQLLDLTYVQDLALAPYGRCAWTEYYVSQYIDHTPLQHEQLGVLLGSRQNQAVDGRYPWSLIGSLREAVAYATDASAVVMQPRRAQRRVSAGLLGDLPAASGCSTSTRWWCCGMLRCNRSGRPSDGGFVGVFLRRSLSRLARRPT